MAKRPDFGAALLPNMEIHTVEELTDFAANSQVLIEPIQDVATITALVVAGLWTYLLFIKSRKNFPSAGIRNRIACAQISHDSYCLHVQAEIKNQGTLT